MAANCRTRRKNASQPSRGRARAAQMWSVLLSIMLIAYNVDNAAAKMDTELLQDDELLMQAPKSGQTEALETQLSQATTDESDEHFNLYRSELKRLSYETIHRILRDENEPIYRRTDAAYRSYKKRAYQPAHEVVRRAAAAAPAINVIPEAHLTQQPQAQHALRLTNAELRHYDAARDYHGKHSAIYALDLSNNLLQDINLSAFTALQQVELANNSLTVIPLNQHDAVSSNIVSLNLNDNQIAHATAVSSASLRELHLSGNQISELAQLNLSMLSALETLDLSCNHIAELETAFFPQRMHFLKHLNLAYNRIGTIYRETFYNLLSLNTLLLSHNNISDIDYETFLALPNLQYLDLSHNQLHGEAIRALQGIPDLVRLSIAYNPEVGASMQEFVASWSLKELDASGTGLCQIPAALAQSVRTLKLTDNWLKIINCGDLDSYPLLQYLDLSHSRIEDIEDDALGRLEILETLFLDHNRLRKVPVSLPTSLEHLFLQHNEIMDLQALIFQGLNNLQTLDLSGNKLLYLPALPLPKLLTLNLRAAGLRGVSQAMVHTLPRLRDLLLDENPIKCSDLLSIAEWASPCRIVERSSAADGSNSTELESFNIERNSIMGDLGEEPQQQQLVGDNRIGSVEQVIASAASAAKLGQHKVDESAVAAVSEEVADAADAATNNELKPNFVRMHNFFEKFKSNCDARRQTAASAPQPPPTPACAVEWEGSGEHEELVTADHSRVSSEPTFNLQNEKLNVKATTTTTSMPTQGTLVGKLSSSVEAKPKVSPPRQKKSKKEVKNVKAEMKLFKFNQKNFPSEMAESSEATATKHMKATTTLPTNGMEVTLDYKTQVTKTTATTTTTTARFPITTPTTTTTNRFPTKTTTTNENIKSTSAERKSVATTATTIVPEAQNQVKTVTTTIPAVAKTLRQLATTTVATGSGVANIGNLLGQQISATIVTATPVNSSTATTVVVKPFTTTTAPKMLEAQNDAAETKLDAALQGQDNGATLATQTSTTTTTNSANAKLTATSSLNNTKEISVNQKQQRVDNAATTAETTTNADVATSLEMAKTASTARIAQQLSERILATQTTDNNKQYMTTAPTTTKTLQATRNTKVVPTAARYLQMKRAQAMPSARTTQATLRVAATKFRNTDEATFESTRVGAALQIGQSDVAKSELTTQKAAVSVEKATTQQPEATIESKSLAKQKVDNNLTRNDSDNDSHKVQANKQEAAEEKDKQQSMIVAAATTVKAINELAKPKTTQFWQQHNFKRANPYPNDISGQRQQLAEEEEQQQLTAESTTEHIENVDTTTTTTSSTHAPTHRHEPLQLHIRDRHLIGTPLLMHRGQNMLVEAAEVLKQTTVAVTVKTTTPTLQLNKASTLKITNEEALAKSQPTEAEHQEYSHPSVEQAAANEQQESVEKAHQQSNNFTHSVSSQAEAINVQTNVTPGHRIGSAEQEGTRQQQQHYDSHADKQMLAGTAVDTTKATTAKWLETTATTTDNINSGEHKLKASGASNGKRHELERKVLPKKHDDIGGGGGGGSGRRKPTLIMKKMTIQTQHTKHTQTPHQQTHYMLNTPRENEAALRERGDAAGASGVPHALAGKLLKAHNEAADNGITHDWFERDGELAELAAMHNLAQHKHSTVNTPIIRDNHARLLAAMDEFATLQSLDAPTAQHSISSQRRDHEPLQVQERAALHSQTQQWLDVRKVGGSTTHPGIVLLLSFSLLAVLLVGLMHVYRCDVLPWRRHLLSHQQRPHLQRQFNAGADDDAHSFLHYHNNGEGQQQPRAQPPPRWHHGERTRANYSSPLHNLHVRELQKTSAVEVEAATRITRSYYDVRPFEKTTAPARRHGSTGSNASGASGGASRNSSTSLSSTRSSSTAGMLDADDAFYVEMTAECGQLGGCVSANEALQCDMLPMELLTVTSSASKRNDECDADTALYEAVSQANVDVEANTVIGAQGSKQVKKAQQKCAGNSAQLNNDSRRKSGAKTVTASSSTRKFDLW
ncbi:uncharacterized protein LOC114804265 [Zeugodacus cucurbitae]|uniref:uncharacterized protein LOC114804265 n=1 Tax=Zeugodacus cucurbitae TaxID=28588 RepID=UPI0023D92095|nr:uncharacterized protein LOC114804265 [Zeugodacus cucurbitae]